MASVARSSGFGMEYGTGLSLYDETGTSDAALPPTIRTTRSNLSTPVSPLPHRTGDSGSRLLRPASIISRTSSYSSLTKERESGFRNKHSAESWIKQTQKSRDQESITSEKSSTSRKSLRRVTSREHLRQAVSAETPVSPAAAKSPAKTGTERIITKAAAPSPNSKARLYLNDSTASEEKVTVDSPVSTTSNNRVSEVQSSPRSSHQTAVTEQATPGHATPKRFSPGKSSIVDSIPTRTSSLHHQSSSPASRKKRAKKSKTLTVTTTHVERPVVVQRSQSIPESSWADLGEDDETVKRIRQLREQRKSRIEESKTFSILAEIPAAETVPKETPVTELASRRSQDSKRASRVRPLANRASTEPPIKAHRVLGITDDTPIPVLTGSAIAISPRAISKSPERLRRPQSRLVDKVSPLTYERPGTAGSPTPPLSLDYSYAQAIDALQQIEGELRREKVHGHKPSAASITIKALDLPPLATRYTPPSPEAVHVRPKSAKAETAKRKVEPQTRWTSHHPDLPLDFDKRKSRRKSMSDARRTRYLEDEIEEARRDSIEDAVVEYLYAPRLNQKVHHPVTGRVVSFSEVGDPGGAAVFICVGMGLTRYVTAFYDELATTLRLRLITVDRPGVGASEAYPPTDRSGPLNWPDDVLAICQQLGITKFSLLAHSAGAVYALATALILPHMIKGKVHLLGPWIPPSQLEAISHPTATSPPAGALPRSQRILRVLPTSFLKAANSSFMTATSASLKPATKRQLDAAKRQQREQSLSPTGGPERPPTATRPDYHRRESMMQMDQFMPDVNAMENFPIPIKEEEEDGDYLAVRHGSLDLSATATPTDPNFSFASEALNAAEHAEKERKTEYTTRLTQRIWELATRDSNPATDLLVCLERHREIGFRYTDVTREVVITHGSEDKRVPVGNVKWLAEQINARTRAGLAGGVAGDAVPFSRDGWVDETHSHGGCEVRVLEGEGHGLMASAPIMSDVLTEIAG